MNGLLLPSEEKNSSKAPLVPQPAPARREAERATWQVRPKEPCVWPSQTYMLSQDPWCAFFGIGADSTVLGDCLAAFQAKITCVLQLG